MAKVGGFETLAAGKQQAEQYSESTLAH